MTNDTVAALIDRSNRLGADPRNTNYAGGNTSAKGRDTDPVTGTPVDLLWVKGSGGDLGTLTESGLAVLRLDRLRALVDVLGEPLGRIRRLIDERHLIASRRAGGAPKVPSLFIVDGRPLASLRGTVFVLHDAGFSDDEAIDWLLDHEESIGSAPIVALREGRKSEVRRVAQALA